jgi:hypothetical protein
MGALVDAALARQLRELFLSSCTPPAAAPLARLLAEGSLAHHLIVYQSDPVAGAPLFDAAGEALIAQALRVNTTLTKLVICQAFLGALELVGALVGHPSLCELDFTRADVATDGVALGAALGALIAADAPALHTLDCTCKNIGDAGLTPIVQALALNRHLHTLKIVVNDMSDAFAREQLLPAVRANTTLRALECCSGGRYWLAAVEAEELVRRRGQHD